MIDFDIAKKIEKAVRCHQAGQFREAEAIYKKILEIHPNHPDALHLSGIIALQSGRHDVAADRMNRAIQNSPDNPICHSNLGAAYNALNRPDQAIACYQKAVELKPDFAEAYHNIGNALQEQGNFNEAILSYQKAVQLNPDDEKTYNNMGLAFQRQGKFDDAVSCYQKTLELEPDIPDTYINMGDALQYQGKFDEAIACYERALELSPDDPHAHSHLLAMFQQTCRWQDIEEAGAIVDELTQEDLDKGIRTPEMPLANLMRYADPRRNLAVAKSWSDDIVRRVSNAGIQFSHKDRKSGSSKIRIGYLSHDFCSHPAAHLTVDLYRLHNRDEFDIFCYSYGEDDGSYYRKRIEKECNCFIDIREMSHGNAAKRIYKDHIDILVDLTGHTEGGRLDIPALRPAPVQVSYLGFLGSTGAEFLDYIITDKIVTPRKHAPYYSEKFAYMPHCYQMNSNVNMEIPFCKREEFGLPEHGFVFCSFNEPYKIEPVMFNIWMKILHQVPGSVLWLYRKSKIVEKNLRREAETRGVNPERLIFAEKVPLDKHLARLKLADLALDTRIYNGGATTSHALRMGVPVITLQGGHFVSRMASSSLTAVGLSELIAHTLEEYEDLAVWLAESPGEVQAIRRRLAKYRTTKPLFDTPRFVRNLETAYKEMRRIFLSGKKPRQIEVKTGNWNQASSIKHQTSSIKHQTSSIKHQTSNIKHQASNIKHQTSSIKHQTSSIKHQTSSICNLGNSLKNQGKLNEAVSCYRKALKLNPKLSQAYISIGNIIQGQGKSDEAVSCYRKALELEPDSAIAFNNMGNVIKDQGDLDEAISCYRKALELNPNMAATYNNLLYQLQQTCDWQGFDDLAARLDDFTQKALDNGIKTAEDPFVNLMRHADSYRNFRVAKSWSDHVSGFVSSLKVDFSHARKPGSSKITVGYLSNTFHNHPGAHLVVNLFGLHKRDEFRIFCYSYGKDDDSYYRKRIVQDCDKFTDIRGMSLLEAATRIHEDQVGILVDLRGHTQGNTLGIPALRPAPVQVSYLGFPGTTGADFFDYIITDRIVAPGHAAYYSENLVFMPHCYQINNHTQAIAEKEWNRRDFGLPEHGFVFCSFNRGYKIEPVMFDAWMRILDQVPESVLWLLPGNRIAETHLRREAQARDVNPERLIFGEILPKAEHLARHRLADLTLDTRIYNGHTTTSDSLWAGLPVITLQGNHFASRVSSSILTAVGLPELITHTLEAYKSLAVLMANTPDELQTIRQKLAKNRLTEPLFDTPRFAVNLEKAYKEMWEIFSAGEKPRQIEVAET